MEFIVTRDSECVCVWSSKAKPKQNESWYGKYWDDRKYTPVEMMAADFKRLFGFTPAKGTKTLICVEAHEVYE